MRGREPLAFPGYSGCSVWGVALIGEQLEGATSSRVSAEVKHMMVPDSKAGAIAEPSL